MESAQNKQWAPQGEEETRYRRAGQLWDQRVGEARVQALNWRRATFLMGLITLLALGGLIYQSAKQDVIPYLVEVEASGKVRLVGAVTEQQWSLPESARRLELERWITNLRALSSDGQILKERFAYVRAHATASATMQLDRYMEREDPFARFGKEMRTVHIESQTRLAGSENAYRVEWQEEVMGEKGEALGSERYVGEFHLAITPPTDLDQLEHNPLGVYVTFFDFAKKR